MADTVAKRTVIAQERTAAALERIAVAIERYADRDPLKLLDEALASSDVPQGDDGMPITEDDDYEIPESDAWRFR